jgi:Xaa-Pro aminopeptidase
MSLITDKIKQAQHILRELDIDCWLTFVRETALNGDPSLPFLAKGSLTWHSAFIVSPGNATAIVGLYDKAAVEDLKAYDSVISYVQGYREPFQEALYALNPRQIAINYSTESEVCDGLTHGMYLTLIDVLAPIGMVGRLCSSEPILSRLRQRKTAWELDAMGRAIAQTLDIYDAVRQQIKPGVTEQDLARFMLDRVKAAGVDCAWDVETCPAVFTGPDTAGAHYGPTDRKVEEGHILNMDFGLRVDGYCSDLQRTFYAKKQGEAATPPDVQKGFDTIRLSIEKARKSLRPGAKGVDVDRIAREVITGAGYEEFPHALGHQVGRFAHDGTALLAPLWEKYGNKPLEVLEEGMVFTLEPRLTVQGRGIVTIEEMVVITSTGAEYLSKPQEELYLV